MKSTIWFQRLNFEVNITNLCFVPPLTSSSFEAGSHIFQVDLKITMQPSRLSWRYRGWRTWSLSTYRIFTALPKGTSLQRWPMPLWSWFSTVAAFSLISLKTSCIYHQSDTSPFSKQTFKYIQRATSITHSSEIQCKVIPHYWSHERGGSFKLNGRLAALQSSPADLQSKSFCLKSWGNEARATFLKSPCGS